MDDVSKFRALGLLDHRLVRAHVINAITAIGRLAGFEAVVVERLRGIPEQHPTFYAVAALCWLLLLRLRAPVPTYNVYKLLPEAAQRHAVAQMCEAYLRKKPDERVRRQLMFLRDTTVSSPEVIDFARSELERALNSAKRTPAKPGVNFNQHAAALALHDLDALFKRIDRRMFLVSGTFLGAVRDGGFIPSEYDIDVGFFASEISLEAIATAMRECGQFVHVSFNEYVIKGVHARGTQVDVFGHFIEDGLVWHGSAKHRWYNTPFELTEITLFDGRYLAPANAETYLNENYGDWRQPCAFWDTSFNTPNCVFPQTKEALLMLVGYAKDTSARYRSEQALQALKQQFGIDYTDQIPSGGSAELAARLQRQPATLVFGAFDPPGPAELQWFEALQARGARIIVAVSSDKIVERLTGQAPQRDAAARAALMRALRCVSEAWVDDGGKERGIRMKAGTVCAIAIADSVRADFRDYEDDDRLIAWGS